MIPRRLIALLLACAVGPCTAFDLSGSWQLDKKASDDPEDALKGLVIYHRSQRIFTDGSDRRAQNPTEQRYWEQQELMKEKRVEGSVARVGPIQQVLDSTTLRIEDRGSSLGLAYESGLRREMTPGDGGPVYSAKGVEYNVDEIGQSLSWRTDDTFVIETMLSPRGKMHEEFSLEAGGQQLTMNVLIENPDWILPGKVKRVFKRQ